MRSRSYSRKRKIAAPIAKGRIVTQTPKAQLNRAMVSVAMAARTSAAATATKAAPNATHRSCWRSTPRARRKRATSDPAATRAARTVTANATPVAASSGPARASSPRSLTGISPLVRAGQ
jgi:hypothetical protein